MPKDLTREDTNFGNIIYQWSLQEYEKHQRGKRWYLVMGALGLLMLIIAVFSSNYLFALILVLFAVVLYLHEIQAPLEVPFAITDTGIVLGKKYYRYSELANFWIIYNPPYTMNLYFSLSNVIRHRLQVPLSDYDPRPVRDYLLQYLEEDLEQEEEPLSDRLSRLMKLH
jgi:hypothetical protein